MDKFIGEFAALGAALAFCFTSTFFTLAGRKLNAMATLSSSLPISMLILMVIHYATLGEVFPLSAPLDRWFFLGLSSISGFVISSWYILRAFQYIGPRLTLLVSSLAPILSTILAWIFLDQALPANLVLGIALVTIGIIWVVADGNKRKQEDVNPNYRKGLLFALAGALGQAFAFVLSSQGVAGGFPSFTAALIRTFVGGVTVWIVLAFQGNLRSTSRLLITETQSMKYILIASVAGPVIGTTLLLLSLQYTNVGVSSTLTSTTPIMLIPIGYVVFKERITFSAVVGTIVAIIGVAILFT